MSTLHCDCDVNELLAEATRDGQWKKCIQWNETTWHLYGPPHRVYITVELSDTPPKEAQP